MRIHHLNTGTMCPIGQRLVNGTGSIFRRARMVCHCLLVETHDGLALVDTGIGLGDIADPPRLGRRWLRQTTPRLDPAETAVRQVRALGYSVGDVRHIPISIATMPAASATSQRQESIFIAGSTTWRLPVGSLRHRVATSRRNGRTVPSGPFMAMMARTGSASRACGRSVIATLMF